MSEWLPIDAEDVLAGDTVRLPGNEASAATVFMIRNGHVKQGAAGHWGDVPWEHIIIRFEGRPGDLTFEPAFALEVRSDEEFIARRVAAIVAIFPGTTPVRS